MSHSEQLLSINFRPTPIKAPKSCSNFGKPYICSLQKEPPPKLHTRIVGTNRALLRRWLKGVKIWIRVGVVIWILLVWQAGFVVDGVLSWWERLLKVVARGGIGVRVGGRREADRCVVVVGWRAQLEIDLWRRAICEEVICEVSVLMLNLF